MTGIALDFYSARDNTEDVVLLDGGILLDAANITRVRLEFPANPDADLDSDDLGLLFDWPVSVGQGAWAGQNAIRLKLGASELATGRHVARLVTFDSDHPNGLVWETPLIINMIE